MCCAFFFFFIKLFILISKSQLFFLERRVQKGRAIPFQLVWHCSYLLIIRREPDRHIYNTYLIAFHQNFIPLLITYTHTNTQCHIDSRVSEMSVRKEMANEDIPGFHVATLLMSNSGSLEPPHGPLNHPHPSILSSKHILSPSGVTPASQT